MADSQRIDDLRRRVQKDPASIAFAQLAEELRRAHEFHEAIDACRAGLAIHPGYLSARVTLGRALVEVNALEDAQAELEIVLKSAPENLAAIRGLAEIFQRQGRMPEALAQYRAALALAKNDPDLQRTVAELAREVEGTKPAAATDGLSFEQMQHELLKAVPPSTLPTAPIAPPETSSTLPSAPSTSQDAESTLQSADSTLHSAESALQTAESARAQQTVEVLERWLDAIHVSRTQRRA